MRLTQIKQILEIERCTSISQAARSLFISQPALSATLNEVEEEIGVQLFHRTKAGVTATEDGAYILDSMKKIMKEVDYIENYNCQADELAGDITVMVGSSYEFLFPELIQRFKKNFPKANLKVLTQFIPNVPNQVAKDLVDFSLMTIFSDSGAYVQNPNLDSYKNINILLLKDCHSVAVMNKAHAKSSAKVLKLSELVSEQLIIGQQYTLGNVQLSNYFDKYPITKIDRITTQQLLNQNTGIFIDSTPLTLEQYQQRHADYKVIPIQNDLIDDPSFESEWPTYFIYKDRPNNKLHQLFLEEIKEVLNSYSLFKK